jgi:tripartite-type tricarboxylate transporter receptor subunit TctC
VIQHIKGGKLIAIAIATPQRSALLPDVPTVAESGLPGFDVTSWYGLVVRAGTPAEIVQRIYRDASEALRSEEVRSKLAGLGLEPMGNTPEQFEKLIASESRKWSDIVRKANIQPQP